MHAWHLLFCYITAWVTVEVVASDSKPLDAECANNDTTALLQIHHTSAANRLTGAVLAAAREQLIQIKTQFEGAKLELDSASRHLFNSGVSGKADSLKAIGTSIEAIDSCVKGGGTSGGCDGAKLASTILATSATLMMTFSLAVPAGPLLAMFGSVILALFASSDSDGPPPLDRGMVKSAVMEALGDFKIDQQNKVEYFVTLEELQNKLEMLGKVTTEKKYESFRAGIVQLKDWFQKQSSKIHSHFGSTLGPEGYRTRLKNRIPFLDSCKATCPPAKEWSQGEKCLKGLETSQEEYARVFRGLEQIMVESSFLSYAHVAFEKIYVANAGKYTEEDWYHVEAIRTIMKPSNLRRLVLQRKSDEVKETCSDSWNPMAQHCTYHENANGKTIGTKFGEFKNDMCNYVEFVLTPCGGYCTGRGKEYIDIGEEYWSQGGSSCNRNVGRIGAALRNITNMDDYWRKDPHDPSHYLPPKGPSPPDAIWGWLNEDLGTDCAWAGCFPGLTQSMCVRPYVCVPDKCRTAWLSGMWQID